MQNKWKITRQLFLFGIVGTIGFLVDVGVLYLVKNLFGFYIGRTLSFISAVFVTWFLNRTFTFKQRSKKSILGEFLYYFWCMIFGGLANLLAYYLLISHYALIAESPIIGVAIGSLVGMLINFITSKFLVFKS